jgi:hypothetical protein
MYLAPPTVRYGRVHFNPNAPNIIPRDRSFIANSQSLRMDSNALVTFENMSWLKMEHLEQILRLPELQCGNWEPEVYVNLFVGKL